MQKEYTQDPIIRSEFPANGRFVFGSNRMGEHFGGAARAAHTDYGAEWGVGEGLTGQSYAFPTLEAPSQGGLIPVTVDSFKASFRLLKETVVANPDLKFYVTKLGLGIAGWQLEEVSEMFHESGLMEFDNVIYPIEFEIQD